ncbi:MAG: hypothetical protein LBR36_09030 [Bacteroidales bacterium]|jgi:hypothetical protein|nr:hypothetical protein [Bacteroidales bacterium]
MENEIRQNFGYSNKAVLRSKKGALSVARLGGDAEKCVFAMQCVDYQAFTPPPPQLTDNQ